MEYITGVYKNVECKVYFFKGWSTYSHPVRPINPIELEDAVKRAGYYRAWMCKVGGRNLFVKFEGIEQDRIETDIKKRKGSDVEVYEAIKSNGSYVVGSTVSVDRPAVSDRFFVSYPEEENLFLLSQKVAMSYEYEYSAEGALKKVYVKDFDGNITALEY